MVSSGKVSFIVCCYACRVSVAACNVCVDACACTCGCKCKCDNLVWMRVRVCVAPPILRCIKDWVQSKPAKI